MLFKNNLYESCESHFNKSILKSPAIQDNLHLHASIIVNQFNISALNSLSYPFGGRYTTPIKILDLPDRTPSTNKHSIILFEVHRSSGTT